ncbi:nucleotide-diphospho-sugar transferase [Inquilinus sp. KBS0705]|nr:nucleotide-diphospho-sugar transferase [Inquilinus sp. KBS0705]
MDNKGGFNTPVLLLMFNRPDTTMLVFERIKNVQPKYLYIAADGPRKNNTKDAELCKQCREITTLINWDCELKTLFRDENLGCGKAVSESINWFFENVDEGIILEDDCLPNDSFFSYCETLLSKYREVAKVMMICGTSYQPKPLNSETYYFSKYAHVWGWATWKRAWQGYNLKLEGESELTIKDVINYNFSNTRERSVWKYNLGIVIDGLDTWDYQLMYWIWKNNGLCIIPWKNMVSNIGFDDNATHTFDAKSIQSKMAQYEITNITHPQKISCNKKADIYERNNLFIESNTKYLIRKLKGAKNRVLRFCKIK